MANIFTYGSLMSESTMGKVALGKYGAVKATLKGYIRRKLNCFKFPGIREDENSTIVGVLWLNVSDEDVRRLDYYEGEGHLYIKTKVEVEVNGVKTESFVYVWNDLSMMLEEEWNPNELNVVPFVPLD